MPEIYVASKTKHGPMWQAFRSEGLPIISTWIDEHEVGATSCFEDLWVRCVSEAARCDFLIAYREPGEVLKGAFIEIGAALVAGSEVLLVGDFAEFSFKSHPSVTTWGGDVREALYYVAARRDRDI